jgi:hypothetical protein
MQAQIDAIADGAAKTQKLIQLIDQHMTKDKDFDQTEQIIQASKWENNNPI